jgi:diphthine-ammonia ligase
MEIFLKEGKLIPKKEWESRINALKERVESEPTKSHEELKEDLKQAILESIKKRVPKEHYAVFLSGGVDSSAIAMMCKKINPDFTCYSVGFRDGNLQEAPDLIEAKKVAEALDLKLVSKTFNLEEAEEIINEAVKVIPKQEANAGFVVKVGVASVVLAVSKLVKEKGDKETIFFSGLGSEEIFAGYQRHENSEDINEECWKGLKLMWERDLVRDCALASHLKWDVRTPLLDPEVIVAAMRIEGNEKIKDGYKKTVFREIAEELGLKKEFAWRKKLGAQYGSRFDKAIQKLAKRENLNYRHEYLERITNGNH